MPTAYGIAEKGGETFLPVILVPVPALAWLEKGENHTTNSPISKTFFKYTKTLPKAHKSHPTVAASIVYAPKVHFSIVPKAHCSV
eukprot:15295651-Ditylum_brightwellii.AAC.1